MFYNLQFIKILTENLDYKNCVPYGCWRGWLTHTSRNVLLQCVNFDGFPINCLAIHCWWIFWSHCYQRWNLYFIFKLDKAAINVVVSFIIPEIQEIHTKMFSKETYGYLFQDRKDKKLSFNKLLKSVIMELLWMLIHIANINFCQDYTKEKT